jgi:hypothetical protein
MRQSVPEVHTFFDETTSAACHIVKDPASNAMAIIDSILDFDAAAGRTHTTHADMLIGKITRNGWQVAWIAAQKTKNVHVGGGKSEEEFAIFAPSGTCNWQCRNLTIRPFR